MSRYTLRVYDGMSHYDFPCRKTQDNVYHSLLDSYPIRALYDRGSKCDILRNVKGDMMSGTIQKKMEWDDKWRVQIYYYRKNDNTILCVTGARTTMGVPDSLIHINDTEISLEPQKMEFSDLGDFNYTLHEKGDNVSNLYNSNSQILFIDSVDRPSVSIE